MGLCSPRPMVPRWLHSRLSDGEGGQQDQPWSHTVPSIFPPSQRGAERQQTQRAGTYGSGSPLAAGFSWEERSWKGSSFAGAMPAHASSSPSCSGKDELPAKRPFLGSHPPRDSPVRSSEGLRPLTVGVKMHVFLHADTVMPGAVGRRVGGVALPGTTVSIGMQPAAPFLPRGRGQPLGDDTRCSASVVGMR